MPSAPTTRTTFKRVALLGVLTGVRAASPIAAVGWVATSGRLWTPRSGPLSFLSRRRVVAACFLAAAGEMVGDKLPSIPARTSTGPLVGRMIVGSFVGAAMATDADRPPLLGIALGAVAALCGAFASTSLRRVLIRRGIANVLVGIAEDGITTALLYDAVVRPKSALA